MRATVAEPQGDVREDGAERSGRQTCDHRNTNRQRGRQWATSVLVNAKSKPHQDTASRAGWHAGKVQVLTRGDLRRESAPEVSRGRSSDDAVRKHGGAKGRRSNCKATLKPVNRVIKAQTSAACSERSRNTAQTQAAPMVKPFQAVRREALRASRGSKDKTSEAGGDDGNTIKPSRVRSPS